ncbi:hypothetical protein NM688_g4245 [Phlebia brevispora]|uniref:Uncharacterized protein n=1 Tax=Phlebia brevispora TaxID=194682 RepID=A0ACC1T3I6_9APHY|nr:hypothetical protein NM688_g4245 [Phlebia brevispora]
MGLTEILPELLSHIISLIVAEYIDAAILGTRESTRLPSTPQDFEAIGMERWRIEMTAPFQLKPIVNVRFPADNPIIPLLCVSFRMRDATLQIVSTTLGIEIVGEGVKRFSVKPTVIINTLRAYCRRGDERATDAVCQSASEYASRNPILHEYFMIGKVRNSMKSVKQRLVARLEEQRLGPRSSLDELYTAVQLNDIMWAPQELVLGIPRRTSQSPFSSSLCSRAREIGVEIYGFLVYGVAGWALVETHRSLHGRDEIIKSFQQFTTAPLGPSMTAYRESHYSLLNQSLREMEKWQAEAQVLLPEIHPAAYPTYVEFMDLMLILAELRDIVAPGELPEGVLDQRSRSLADYFYRLVEVHIPMGEKIEEEDTEVTIPTPPLLVPDAGSLLEVQMHVAPHPDL